ncbi:MAG: glycosyltransferase family 4 protein [Proteobacteria bacterium]|nr:glycosyltransferase family 4 protein [Pseudomonadota bacterium]
MVATAAGIVLTAAVIAFALLLALRPLLQRYALALPNARSSHKTPTPQGAGIGVIASTIIVTMALALKAGDIGQGSLWIVMAATAGIAIVGAADDIAQLGVAPRLLLQGVAVAAILFALPGDMRIVPMLPFWLERALLGIGAVWFVNLVNFMDGIDWITAAETIPITAFLVAISAWDQTSELEIAVALALCGAMLGFAPLNKPVAKMFLGDVGSLAIGLLLAWLLIGLAGRGYLTAAILLPLYYIADATVTLLRRLMRGEKVWVAHRTHFYQRATQNGFTVMQTVTRIFAVNIALGLLAMISVIWDGIAADYATPVAGAMLVTWLLRSFAKGRPSKA